MTVVLRYIIVAPPFLLCTALHWCYRKKPLKRSHLFKNFFKKTSDLYRGYFQKRHQMCPSFSTFFQKNSLSTGDYQKKHFKALHLKRTFSQKKLQFSTGVISKTTPSCVADFGKNPKKIFTSPLTIKIATPFCCIRFQLFSKKA